nr:MAG TPA: hypothetical protein [Caudoviricetes sp.]
MIVEKSFIDAITYAQKHDIMIRPEYWSSWMKYVKDKSGFCWCTKEGSVLLDHGLDKYVLLTDKILAITKWEFMCDELIEDGVPDKTEDKK